MNINIATEISDTSFHFTRTSVFSFIETNKWFNGTIYLISHQSLPVSNRNIEIIRSIYPKVEVLDVTGDPVFAKYLNVSSRQNTSAELYLDLRFALFNLKLLNILFFSSSSIFFSAVTDILSANTFTASRDLNLFYLARPLTISKFLASGELKKYILDQAVDSTGISYMSSEFIDSKFHQLTGKLAGAQFITFDTFGSTAQKYTRINQVWLHKNHIISQKLLRPSSFTKISPPTIPPRRKEEPDRKRKPVPLSTRNKEQPDHKGQPATSNTAEIDNFIKISKIKEPDKRYALNKNLLFASIQDMKLISNANFLDSPIEIGYETACVIAFKDRHTIVELNVKTLCEQSLTPAIVLVVSNLEDALFSKQLKLKYPNVFITHHQNYPMGGKWQAGVDYDRKLNVSGLMILGSDDLLSLNYFKTCYSEIDGGLGSSGVGVDLIGSRRWLIYDINKKLYELEYLPSVPIFLGGGKMFSKYFLDSVNWKIFRKYRHMHLDEYGYAQVKKFSNNIKIISKDNFILSVKGNWELINSTAQILKAKHRISSINITKNTKEIFNQLKILNIDSPIINNTSNSLKFLIIFSGLNCGNNIKKCFTSLIDQTYKNFKAILISDGSTDTTANELTKVKNIDSRISVEIYEDNKAAAYRRYYAINNSGVDEETVIILVGLDDHLFPNALMTIKQQYDSGKWMTYGNWISQHGKMLPAGFLHFDEETHKNRDYRKVLYRSTGLNTFKKFLFDNIPVNDFKIDGKWIDSTTESELMFSCLEMCGKDKIGIIEKAICQYNQNLPGGTLLRLGSDYKYKIYNQIILRPKKNLLIRS